MSARVYTDKKKTRKVDVVQLDEEGDHRLETTVPRLLPADFNFAHQVGVASAEFSLDGQYVATAGFDSRAIISRVNDGQLAATLHHGTVINSMAWLQQKGDSRKLATAGTDGCVNVWTLNPRSSGCSRLVYQQKYGIEVEKMKYDQGSGQLLMAFSHALSIWDVRDTEICRESTKPILECMDIIGGVCFFGSGTQCIASFPHPQKLFLISVKSGVLKVTDKLPVPYRPRHIAASNDALTFAVGDLDGVIHIYRWEANNLPSEMSSICYPRAYIVPRPVTFTFFHGARFLLVGSEEGEAIVLDLMIKARAASFQHPKGNYVPVVAAWSGGETISMVTASSHGSCLVVLWQCSLSAMLDLSVTIAGTVNESMKPGQKARQGFSFVMVFCFLTLVVTLLSTNVLDVDINQGFQESVQVVQHYWDQREAYKQKLPALKRVI